MKARAVARGHVTGFFKIYENGSTGAGFNIENAMRTSVEARITKKNSVKILINGKKSNAVTSRIVVKKYLQKTGKKFAIKVCHETKYPIGYGLGLSGAGALSLSEALNKALGTRTSKKEVVEIARLADIEAGTGLGDVIAEQYRGMLIGKPPYPSMKATRIKNDYTHAVFAFFGPIKTRKIVRSAKWRKRINKEGGYCMRELNKKRSAENFAHLSRVFALETGLAKKQVRRIMEEFDTASMAMLGNTAFVLTNEPWKIMVRLKNHCRKIILAKIA